MSGDFRNQCMKKCPLWFTPPPPKKNRTFKSMLKKVEFYWHLSLAGVIYCTFLSFRSEILYPPTPYSPLICSNLSIYQMRFHQTCYICNISKVHLQHLFEIKYTTWILQQVPFSRVFIMAGICNSHKRSNLRLFAVIFTNQSKQNAPHLEINHFFWHAWLLIALLIFFNYIYTNVWRVWHALLKRHWNKSKLDVI